MASTTVYLRLKAKRGYKGRLSGFTVESVTKTRPDTAPGPVVKLRLIVPDEVFEPHEVSAVASEHSVLFPPHADVEPIEDDPGCDEPFCVRPLGHDGGCLIAADDDGEPVPSGEGGD